MSSAEVASLDAMQKDGRAAGDILETLQKRRRKAGKSGPSEAAAYRAMGGKSYKRNAKEKRGRHSKVPLNFVKVASQVRLRLAKAANSNWLVTWAQVHKETRKKLRAKGSLTRSVKMPGVDMFARRVRSETGVRARPGKRRITHEKDYKARRLDVAMKWVRYSQEWWQNEIHAYIDNKKFVIPRTLADKMKIRAQRVHHHLRTPAEGNMDCFVIPKKQRMLIGLPSVDVTAAVAQDRIIFWHENEGPWYGEKAKQMYEKLGDALRRHYGEKCFYRVVEDGDPKGFQSGKGIEAKRSQKIRSWKLPPHSPGLMPLDFCLWNEIEGRTLGKRGHDNEGMTSYKRRLNLTAKRLPRSIIKNCLGKMKENLKATVASKGSHTRLD